MNEKTKRIAYVFSTERAVHVVCQPCAQKFDSAPDQQILQTRNSPTFCTECGDALHKTGGENPRRDDPRKHPPGDGNPLPLSTDIPEFYMQ